MYCIAGKMALDLKNNKNQKRKLKKTFLRKIKI
jgi:hypothetical protein